MLIRGIASTAIATALLVATPSADAARRTEVVVVAHAGGAAMAPANTLLAVETSLRRGADVVENDIQRTADHHFVVFHDRSLAAATDVEELYPGRGPWLVSDFTLAEVRRLRVWGHRIPTLAEWGRAVGDAGMMIEAKDPGFNPGSSGALGRELMARPVFRRAIREDRLVVMSFNQRWMERFERRSHGDIDTGIVYDYHVTPRELRKASHWADYYVPHYTLTDEATVDLARDLGMQTYIWTLYTPKEIRLAKRLGADGLITDMAQPVRSLLREWRQAAS